VPSNYLSYYLAVHIYQCGGRGGCRRGSILDVQIRLDDLCRLNIHRQKLSNFKTIFHNLRITLHSIFNCNTRQKSETFENMRTLTTGLSRSARRLRATSIFQRQSSSTATAHLPRFAQPNLWSSLVPRFLRRSHEQPESIPNSSRFRLWLRNPSTFLIALAMFTGSQAIQVMQLRSDAEERRQTAQRRIDTLREVIDKVQRGEEVDLRKELGTGNPQAEKEWQDVIDQIPDDSFWLPSKLKKNKVAKKSLEDGTAALDVEKFSGVSNTWWSLPFRSGDKPSNQTKAVEAKPQTNESSETPLRRAFY
jgi:hypothetical protein